MSKKRVKPPHVELKIVLDTNALYNGSANYFLKREVADLIKSQSAPDLTMKWIVPEIVRHERQFQMTGRALEMLPTIERLERLLGHNLNITKDILEARVREAVDKHVADFGVIVHSLDLPHVDWQRLMMDAAYRRPPFQRGETEKGFRDALILESFVQLASSTTRNNRAALVSGDALLREAAHARVDGPNVYILESVDALKGLINTLGSAVDEKYIAEVTQQAERIFFVAKDANTLYYKWKIGDALDAALRGATFKLPDTAERYNVEKWTIKPPRFARTESTNLLGFPF
jgi:hypothetical protein